MTPSPRLPFSDLDLAGLLAWLLLWAGYQWWAGRPAQTRPNLNTAVRPLRRQWMRQAFERENRVTDAALVGNLMQSATFLASTTLLVIGGLLALLGTVEKGTDFVQSLPFAQKTGAVVFELKTLVLVLVFVYALLRFTWSLRLFNLLNIVVGAYGAPSTLQPRTADDMADRRPGIAQPAVRASSTEVDPETLIRQGARLNELAGLHFTQGLRAYYYAVPILLWLVHPWLLVAGSVAITVLTYLMEFRSETVLALSGR